MNTASSGELAVGALGGLIVVVALADLFLTVFNYDGFSFLANRLHGVLWSVLRTLGRLLPQRSRHTFLSLASASMLPATYALWLGLEIIGFALIYWPGLHGGDFARTHTGTGLGAAFYLSAGDLSSLTFGDVVARTGLMRAMVDLETIVGLTTFTLALGYVVTTFDVLRTLDGLHSIVRRHAEDPAKPFSILSRHFRGGQPTELPSLLGEITGKLEDYDQGLRRYPVVYYFHTRRLERSIPHIFRNLGRLVALLRWGLPADEPMTQDPLLAALIDQYGVTLERLQRSFVGPRELDVPPPASPEAFRQSYAAAARAGTLADQAGTVPAAACGAAAGVEAFRDLQERARRGAGLEPPGAQADDRVYEQYREWLPFARRDSVVLQRIADALGYRHA